MNPINPIQLQRLIDGEISSDDLQQFSADLKQQPALSQTIAAALIEDRVWRNQFGNDSSEKNQITPASEASFSNVAPTKSTEINITSENPIPNSSLPKSNLPKSVRKPRFQVRPNWLAIAASALFAAMLGYTLGQQNQTAWPTLAFNPDANPSPILSPGLNPNPSPTVSSNPAPQPAIPKLTPASLTADYHLELPGNSTSSLVGEVPLYQMRSAPHWRQQFRELNQASAKNFQVTPELMNRLHANGFRVQQDIEFVSGNLQDGRTFVVPIRSIQFVPGQ